MDQNGEKPWHQPASPIPNAMNNINQETTTLWNILHPTTNASCLKTPKEAARTEGEVRPGDFVIVRPHSPHVPSWMRMDRVKLPYLHPHSGECGTVLQVLGDTSNAIIRIRSKQHPARVSAVPMHALQILTPAVDAMEELQGKKLTLEYVSHRGKRGWVGITAALLDRTGLRNNLTSRSRVADGGAYFYLDERQDGYMLMAFLRQCGVDIELATSLIESDTCPIDSMVAAV